MGNNSSCSNSSNFLSESVVLQSFDNFRHLGISKSFEEIIKESTNEKFPITDYDKNKFLLCHFQLRRVKNLHYALLIIGYDFTELCDRYLCIMHDKFLYENKIDVESIIKDQNILYYKSKVKSVSYLCDLIISESIGTIIRIKGPKELEVDMPKTSYMITLSFLKKIVKNVQKNFGDYNNLKNNCLDFAKQVYNELTSTPAYDFSTIYKLAQNESIIPYHGTNIFIDEIFNMYEYAPELADLLLGYLSFMFHDCCEDYTNFKSRMFIFLLRTKGDIIKYVQASLIEIETTQVLIKNGIKPEINIGIEKSDFINNMKNYDFRQVNTDKLNSKNIQEFDLINKVFKLEVNEKEQERNLKIYSNYRLIEQINFVKDRLLHLKRNNLNTQEEILLMCFQRLNSLLRKTLNPIDNLDISKLQNGNQKIVFIYEIGEIYWGFKNVNKDIEKIKIHLN